MQQLVEDVSGTPFAEYMRDEVLKPMGMTNSTFQQPLPTEMERRAATGYRTDRSEVPGRWHVYPEMAAAGLWTTPTDLAKYVIGVQQAVAGKSKVLSAARRCERVGGGLRRSRRLTALSAEANRYRLHLAHMGTPEIDRLKPRDGITFSWRVTGYPSLCPTGRRSTGRQECGMPALRRFEDWTSSGQLCPADPRMIYCRPRRVGYPPARTQLAPYAGIAIVDLAEESLDVTRDERDCSRSEANEEVRHETDHIWACVYSDQRCGIRSANRHDRRPDGD